jgi:hypothetical protein
MNTDKPAINLLVSDQIPNDRIAEICYGMEEEGVPGSVEHLDSINPLELAHSASVASRLGVGIGVALDYAVITTEKLPSDRPYIAVHMTDDPRHNRMIGANAARLVKRIPLLPMD